LEFDLRPDDRDRGNRSARLDHDLGLFAVLRFMGRRQAGNFGATWGMSVPPTNRPAGKRAPQLQQRNDCETDGGTGHNRLLHLGLP
jgi:hypothetical protein